MLDLSINTRVASNNKSMADRRRCGVSTRGFIDTEDTLVPVPGSAASSSEHAWVAERLAEALVSKGLGQVAWPGLRRVSSVRKSAYAQVGARPSVQRHYEWFAFS